MRAADHSKQHGCSKRVVVCSRSKTCVPTLSGLDGHNWHIIGSHLDDSCEQGRLLPVRNLKSGTNAVESAVDLRVDAFSSTESVVTRKTSRYSAQVR